MRKKSILSYFEEWTLGVALGLTVALYSLILLIGFDPLSIVDGDYWAIISMALIAVIGTIAIWLGCWGINFFLRLPGRLVEREKAKADLARFGAMHMLPPQPRHEPRMRLVS